MSFSVREKIPDHVAVVRLFFSCVFHRFKKNRCATNAAALTLTTLLSLVPVIAVVLSVFTTFPAFERLGEEVKEVMFLNLPSGIDSVIQEQLLGFLEQARRVRLIGTILFVVTALILVREIEFVFSEIWEIERRRRGVMALLVYWAMLSVGPLLIGLSIALTSYFTSLSMVSDVVAPVSFRQLLYNILVPFLLTTAGTTLLYWIVPNRPVRLSHALSGGITAAILLEVGKRGFALYVQHITTYQLVFGAMAALPLFLLWIYLTWMVVLLGAEITSAFPRYRHFRREQDEFSVGFGVLSFLSRAHRKGEPLGVADFLEMDPTLSEPALRRTLRAFERIGLVSRLEKGEFQLARDLRTVTLADLYRLLPWRLPRPLTPSERKDRRVSENYEKVLIKAAESLDNVLDIPLEEFFHEAAP